MRTTDRVNKKPNPAADFLLECMRFAMAVIVASAIGVVMFLVRT